MERTDKIAWTIASVNMDGRAYPIFVKGYVCKDGLVRVSDLTLAYAEFLANVEIDRCPHC